MAEGPRALRPDEWDQLNDLVSTVFRSSMVASYPQLFNEENRENLRVVAEDGRVVCHVGVIRRPATLAGCRIGVACVGAVATYEAYRGHGFASAAFQECCELAAAAGDDLLLVSGGRGLYTRVGCRRVGPEWDVIVEGGAGPDAAKASGAVRAGEAADGPPPAAAPVLAPIGAEHIDTMAALYRAEPVRFLRPREDWRRALDCRVVMAARSDFWGIFLGGDMVAYLIAHPPVRSWPVEPGQVSVVEFAGDRAAIAGVLPRLQARYEAQRLRLHVQAGDLPGRAYLARAGGTAAPAFAWGTARVLNFPKLMERCRPLLAERIGTAAAGALRFEADAAPGSPDGGVTIRQGSRLLRVPDLGALANYLFGVGAAPASVAGDADLAALLAEALPLPVPWYGINYV